MPSLDSYYQPDFSHRSKPKSPSRSSAPQYDIGLDGVPVVTSGGGGGGLRDFGPEYAAKERSAFNKARAHDIRTKPSSVTRTDGGPREETILPPTETITNVNGVVQTGKNLGGGGTPIDMGKSYAALLSEMGLSGYSSKPAFSSTQLPTTVGSPDQPLSAAGQGVLSGIKAGQVTDSTIEGYTKPNYTSIQPSDPIFAEAFGQDLADQRTKEGGSGNLEGISSGRLSDALKDTASMQGTMSDTPENRRLMARAAMLSDNDVMQNLKVRDAQQGKVYAGGQHYIAGESADSPAVKIDRSQARDISSGKTDAQSLLAAHILKNKEGTPAESQAPLTTAVSAVKDGFAAGAQTDFALNNGNAQTNKPGQKTIDSDFMESADFSDPAVLAEYERRMNQLK